MSTSTVQALSINRQGQKSENKNKMWLAHTALY